MQIGGLIIGDELLSGKRRDKHMDFLISVLARRGLELSFVRFVGDDPGLLTESLRQTLDSQALIFSFGGIGATPDDRTRQCFARAANVELGLHPEAVAILEERFGEQAIRTGSAWRNCPWGARSFPTR